LGEVFVGVKLLVGIQTTEFPCLADFPNFWKVGKITVKNITVTEHRGGFEAIYILRKGR
jgi:hypothetical protein